MGVLKVSLRSQGAFAHALAPSEARKHEFTPEQWCVCFGACANTESTTTRANISFPLADIAQGARAVRRRQSGARRWKPLQVAAGRRFELYSFCAIRVLAVSASVSAAK